MLNQRRCCREVKRTRRTKKLSKIDNNAGIENAEPSGYYICDGRLSVSGVECAVRGGMCMVMAACSDIISSSVDNCSSAVGPPLVQAAARASHVEHPAYCAVAASSSSLLHSASAAILKRSLCAKS